MAGKKKNVIIVRGFNDTVRVHTAPSGTQYVRPSDIILDKDTLAEMKRLSETVRTRLKAQAKKA